MKDRVVYLLQQPSKGGLDLSSASKYGRIETLLTAEDRPTHAPGPCLRKLREILQHMTQDDFLVWAGGDMTGVFLLGMAIMDLPFKQVNMLRWERELDQDGNRTGGGFYMPVTVTKRDFFGVKKDHELVND